jgi:WD40 repeat protein
MERLLPKSGNECAIRWCKSCCLKEPEIMLKARTGVALAFLALCGWAVTCGASADETTAGKAEEKAKPALDSFGDPLPAYARLRLGTVRFRQGSPIASLRYLPDGKTLLSIGNDQVIRYWEASTGKERYRFGTPVTPMYNPLAFPD